MHELGQVLREQRQKLGLSIDDVERQTKIRRRYLEAVEDGDWSVLPGNVYARGFVRSYAEVVGLDGLELLQRFVDEKTALQHVEEREKVKEENAKPTVVRAEEVQAASEGSDVDPKRSTPVPPSTPVNRPTLPGRRYSRRTGRRMAMGGQVAIVVAALLVVGGVLTWIKHSSGSHGQPPKPSAVAAGSNNNTTNSSNSTDSAGTGENTGTNNTSTGNNTTTGANSTQITPGTFSGGQENYSVQSSGPMTVQVSVTGAACWMAVTANQTPVAPNLTLSPGQEKEWTGKDVEIRLGHVQGVAVTVNGQAVVLPSTNSAVNVTFTKSS